VFGHREQKRSHLPLGMRQARRYETERIVDQAPEEPNLIYLLGQPVSRSLSSVFQNAALEAEGFAWRYVARSVSPEELGIALRGLVPLGVVGANITAPYKETALTSMDRLGPEAAIIGAVNTVQVNRGRLQGDNTDVDGFLGALREGCPAGPPRPAALLLGAGGAARAAAWALIREGLIEELVVASRTPEKGQRLFNMIRNGQGRRGRGSIRFNLLPDADLIDADQRGRLGLVVNATPVGSDPADDRSLLSGFHGFAPDTFVFDMVYQVRPTPLLRLARAADLPAEDGLAMLRHQGARSFQLWTGRPAPMDIMRTALDLAVRAQEGA
jgi:shikimate dehydrogenase